MRIKKNFITLCCILLAFTAKGQADFLVLKKRNKTIDRYFEGNTINCRLRGNEWIRALIITITKDSIFLKPFQEAQFLNAIGIPYSDTLWANRRKIAISSIDAFPREDESFQYIKNGAIFQIAGGGYIALNVINTLSAGDQLFDDNNGTNLAIAAGVLAIGTIMHITYSPYIRLGKKYKLQALP